MDADKPVLLPCPFCDQPPHVQEREDFWLGCINGACCVQPYINDADCETLELAREAWNRRASGRTVTVDAERLKEADAAWTLQQIRGGQAVTVVAPTKDAQPTGDNLSPDAGVEVDP